MKRVLVVDDEPNVIDGLRRSLHKQRKRWDIEFCIGGQEAIDRMQEESFDVLITDMRMPGVDGVQVLEFVKRHHPETIRIVLSGHAEVEAALRALPMSHQFLSKPCDAETLVNAVESATQLQTMLQDPRLRVLVNEVRSLPTLPETYRVITKVLADPEASIDEVVVVVNRDPSLSAKILQLANSSFFCLSEPVGNVQRAVNLLGVALVRDLVLAEELFRPFPEAKHLPGFDLDEEHGRALLAGALAKEILKSAGEKRRSEDAFTTAIMQDVGRLLLATQDTKRFKAVLEAQKSSGRSEIEVERDQLGVTHAQVGAYLLALWGLPYPMVRAVAFHHEPGGELGGILDLTTALWVANALVAERRQGIPVDELSMETLGLADHLDEWRALIEKLDGGPREEASA